MLILFSLFALMLPNGATAPEPWQSWAQANKMPQPPIGITLKLTDYGCENEGDDCSYPWGPRPMIWMVNVADGVEHYQLLHELGHVFDWRHRKPADHRWRRQLVKTLGWHGWSVEGFAMAYSWCAMNPNWPAYRHYPGYDYWPTVQQHRRVCRLIVARR
jgi:hypothetical protein